MNDSTAPVEAQHTEPGAAKPNADSPAQATTSPISTQPMPPAPPVAPTAPLPPATPLQPYPAQAEYQGSAGYPAQAQAVPQPWPGQQGGPSYATPYAPVPYAQPLLGGATSSRPGLVIAVISLIVSGIALLAVIGMAVFMVAGPAGMMAPLTGQVPSVSPSTSLSADRLSSEITVRMEDDGWVVDEMNCPVTPKVAQGVVSVCHATMDEGEWAVVVYFEDDQGTYTLNVF